MRALCQLSSMMNNQLASKAELSCRRLACKPHIRRDDRPNHCPAFGTREFQGDTTL
jgi:hypothetical protein